MKIKLLLLNLIALLFTTQIGLHAIDVNQIADRGATTVSSDDWMYVEQLGALNAFIKAAELSLAFDITRGEFSCAPETTIMEMANQLTLSSLVLPSPNAAINPTLRGQLESSSAEVRALIESAKNSTNCAVAPTKNDKCCRVLSQGDVCITRDDKYCRTTGVQVIGCTASSDEC